MKASPLILPLIGAPPLVNLSPLADETLTHVARIAKMSYRIHGKYPDIASDEEVFTAQDWRNVMIHVFAVSGGRNAARAPELITTAVDEMIEEYSKRGDAGTSNKWPKGMPKELTDILDMLIDLPGVSIKKGNIEEIIASMRKDEDDNDGMFPLDSKHILLPDSRTTFILFLMERCDGEESLGTVHRAFTSKQLALDYVKSRAPHPSCVLTHEDPQEDHGDGNIIPPTTRLGYHGKTIGTITEVTIHKVMPE